MPRIDYNAWATDYDATRRASAGVASAVLAALGPPQARLLLDIGGGTGNFTALARESGFRVTIIDVATAMLGRAAAKLGTAVDLTVGDAEHLPYKSGSFDCAMCINVLRHLPNRAAALAEARRVVHDGPLVIRTTTRETEKSHWAHAYFPTLASHQPSDPTEEQLKTELERVGFSKARLSRFWYRDDGDGSFQALKYQPEALLEAARTQSVAVFKRLPRSELEQGVDRLRRDLHTGRIRDVVAAHGPLVAQYGDGIVVCAG